MYVHNVDEDLHQAYKLRTVDLPVLQFQVSMQITEANI